MASSEVQRKLTVIAGRRWWLWMMVLCFLLLLQRPVVADTIVAVPLTLEVSISWTTNLFHIVDQISDWDEAAHKQYQRYYKELSGKDRLLLEEYAVIRRGYGWQGGMEMTFYTNAPFNQAIETGIQAGHLSREHAEKIKNVLLHFAPRVRKLFNQEKPYLEAYVNFIKKDKPYLNKFFTQISEFCCKGNPITVPVFLIANPSKGGGGGGTSRGKVVVEVPSQFNGGRHSTLYHEVVHAFFRPSYTLIRDTAAGVDGLDGEGLNEAITYAIEGLINNGRDLLVLAVWRDFAARKPLVSYTRNNRFGLALRPLIRRALNDKTQSLETFLPKAADAWRVMLELGKAIRPTTRYFTSGPGYRVLHERLKNQLGAQFTMAFNLRTDHYKKYLANPQPGDRYVMLFALDQKSLLVPTPFDELMPRPLEEVLSTLRNGRTMEVTGKTKGLIVILLAAPSIRELENLIRVTAALN